MNNRRSFIIGIKSTKLSIKEKTFLKRYKPWGVILFTRNIKNIEQTYKLTSTIRKIFNDKKYPILVDQEGGRVNRLKNIISFDNLTSEFFGEKYKKNLNEFAFFYKLFIDKTSYLLKSIGININTVPILDLRLKGASNIIGDRSFSKDPKIVSKIGDLCIKQFHENGIGTVMKHIPGPDFPTGGTIIGKDIIKTGYKTGRGTFKVRGNVSIEQLKNGKERLVINSIKYQINKSVLNEKIVVLIRNK